MPPHGLHHGRQVDHVPGEEADQRRGDEPRARCQQLGEVFHVQYTRARLPDTNRGGTRWLQPRRGTGGKIEIVDDDFVSRAQSHRQRR